MEDLPKELEKEIKKLCQPVKMAKKGGAGLFLINDFGKVKPVGWIKTFIALISLTTFFITLLTFLLYYLYSDLKIEKIKQTQKLVAAEKKINTLINEKEILMARLVISGNNVDLTNNKSNTKITTNKNSKK
ncbi:MAG: hypothetical protein B6I26_01835 [Desulfobacteraceae bacterium 4572_130]|nr:MAG: hypothetical protein B6I26_01835 [Desulfobacteraceae bacterium 4572_130]